MTSSGRLADVGDIDDYALHIDDRLSSLLLDIKLVWRGGPDRQMFLDDAGVLHRRRATFKGSVQRNGGCKTTITAFRGAFCLDSARLSLGKEDAATVD